MSLDEPPHGADFQQQLACARHGSGDELGRLLNQYRHYLLSIARQEVAPQVAGKVGASDLVQDTLVHGLEGFADFDGTTPEQLAGWLRQILLNLTRNVIRAYGTEKRDVAREEPADSDLAALGEGSASRILIARERDEQFQQALARLPDELRRVIELRHRDCRSFAEIGQQIGKSEDTARRIWARAIEQLQGELMHDESSFR